MKLTKMTYCGLGMAITLAGAHFADAAPGGGKPAVAPTKTAVQPSASELEQSPYEACKDVAIVSKRKYDSNAAQWKSWAEKCNLKLQLADDAGWRNIDPLTDSMRHTEYLNFAEKVAQNVIGNLEKSKKYADCTKLCFSGAESCSPTMSHDGKSVSCSERKDEVQTGLKVQSRKIRMDLALTRTATQNRDTVLPSLKDEEFLNINLADFEATTPNPVGRTRMQPRELEHAKGIMKRERAALEEEFKALKGSPQIYSSWMTTKLEDKMKERQEKYRTFMYEEAPIFAVIDKPVRFDKGDEPVWEDKQLAKAFGELSDNAAKTMTKVNHSLAHGKLEFSRWNLDAVQAWLLQLVPLVDDRTELLYYMGMKKQVEELLQKDKNFCGIATTLINRLGSKEGQNGFVTLVALAPTMLIGGPAGKEAATQAAQGVFRVTRALTGAQSAALTGLGLGSAFLGESFHRYSTATTEAASSSGVGGNKEGVSTGVASRVDFAKTGVAFNLVFAPVLGGAGWGLGKTLYNSLGKKMWKDHPAVEELLKKAGNDEAARDAAVDLWIGSRVKTAVKMGTLQDVDVVALKSQAGAKIMDSLAKDIQKTNPNFFKDDKNFDFFLQTAATTLKRKVGDPDDLADKAKHLFVSFNPEAFQQWDPRARQGLMKVFNEAVEELRTVYAKNPGAYAKLKVDPSAQEQVMIAALRRLGVEEKEARAMFRCALPKGGAAL